MPVTARDAVIACGAIGLTVTERTIRTWRETGQLRPFERADHGKHLYDLADVVRLGLPVGAAQRSP